MTKRPDLNMVRLVLVANRTITARTGSVIPGAARDCISRWQAAPRAPSPGQGHRVNACLAASQRRDDPDQQTDYRTKQPVAEQLFRRRRPRRSRRRLDDSC